MDSTPPAHQTYLSQSNWRNRLVSFLLAGATTVLIALLMLAMGAMQLQEPGKPPAQLVAIQIHPPQPAPKSATVRAHAKTAQAPPRHQSVQQPPVVRPPIPVSPFLHLSKEEYAASDISKLPSHSPDSGKGNATSSYGPGEGPGGVTLYEGEWYSFPYSDVAPYLPKIEAPSVWGIVACKMMEDHRVEDCHEVDESPGSGMARAMRQASWKFRVRPPSINGHLMIGVWVKLKLTIDTKTSNGPGDMLVGADQGQ